MHPPAINKYLISAHTILSCTMLVGGPVGKVLGLSGASWPILWPWQDWSKHLLFKKKSKNQVEGGPGGLGWGQKVVWHMPWGALIF